MNPNIVADVSVPFLNIQAQNQSIWPELQQALEAVTSQGQFVLGLAVERFEKSFAAYLDRKHAVGVNNSTSALHLALQACDVGPGDEVITTPHTWISTSWAISYVGAKPVFVDIDPRTYNIDPALIERAITPRTKAILPVHLYGQSCDMDALGTIADQHGLLLIEDAAQAHGARWGGRRVGSFGKISCFGFYPGKNLGAFGEGGAVATDDDALAARIRRQRDHAQDGRHLHVEIGYNMRMEGIQGAVLDVKLPHLDDWNSRRGRHARRYGELLADVPGVQLPVSPSAGSHVWHLFVVLIRGKDRDVLQRELGQRGVGTGVHYPTLVPFQPVYSSLGYKAGDFPIAEDVAKRCLSLPMFAELTDGQIAHVAEVLSELTGK